MNNKLVTLIYLTYLPRTLQSALLIQFSQSLQCNATKHAVDLVFVNWNIAEMKEYGQGNHSIAGFYWRSLHGVLQRHAGSSEVTRVRISRHTEHSLDLNGYDTKSSNKPQCSSQCIPFITLDNYITSNSIISKGLQLDLFFFFVGHFILFYNAINQS